MSSNKRQRNSALNIVITVLVAIGAIAYFSAGRSSGRTPGAVEERQPSSEQPPKVSSAPANTSVVPPPAAPPASGAPARKTQAEEFAAKLQASNELPEDLKRQLAAQPAELPDDLKAQLHAPPPELPDDLKQQMLIPPRTVTLDEVNHPPQ